MPDPPTQLSRLIAALASAYAVQRELASGGMATVYLAEDLKHHRRVAIKVLRPELAGALGPERFVREIEIAAHLTHPHILPLHDSGVALGLLYYVMPYVEGESLRQRLSREKQLPVEEGVEIARQVASALTYAHGHGIVHRDIKPENILLTAGEALVADFGIARAVTAAGGTRLTDTGIAVGTPAYMSPEQASGTQDLDARSDVYALGCVLYEMLAGDPPFTGPTAQVITARKLTESAPNVAVVRDTVPPSLAEALRKALHRVPADRYATAAQFADALRRRDEQGPATTTVPGGPVVSRRGLFAGTAATGLLGFAGGAILSPRQAVGLIPSYRRLTFQRGMIRTARFAPDSQTILYGGLWDGDVCRVYQVRPDNPESHPIGLPSAAPLAISSQGEVALAVGSHFRGVMTYGTLARVPLAGGVPRELVEDVKYADWSPDGNQLAVVRRVEGRDRLEFPVGEVLTESATGGSVAGLSFPRVAPAGDRVAFFELPFGLRGHVAVVDRRGVKRVLTDEFVNVFGLAWHGEEIWFTAADQRPLFRAIHVIGRGGEVRLVARVPGNVSLHDISPDARFVMAHTDDRHQCAVLRSGEARERHLSWLDASAPADLSPDGRVLLFTEFGHGGGPANSVYLRPTDGSPAVRLGEGRAAALSPDGRWALALAASDPSPVIDVLPTAAGEARRLQHPGLRYHAARWLPDSRRIVMYAREGDEAARLYVGELGDVRPRAITPAGTGPSWAVSPDGSAVAAIGPDQRLRLFPVEEDGEPRSIPGLLSGEVRLLGWVTDGVLFTNELSGMDLADVRQVDPETGLRRPWKAITPPDPAGVMYVSNLQVTPDGGSYAYSWHRALSDLYIVEGLT